MRVLKVHASLLIPPTTRSLGFCTSSGRHKAELVPQNTLLKSLLRHLLRLKERPIMRYIGFTTEITVKTAGASHAFVEFVERNFDMLLAGLWGFDSAYPANPIPTGKWGNFLPYGFGFWGSCQCFFKIFRNF